jgi:hypothetical protein
MVDVGRVSEYLLRENYKAGDKVILIPRRDRIQIINERDLDRIYPEAKYHQGQLFNNLDQDLEGDRNGEVLDPLLDLLGGEQ